MRLEKRLPLAFLLQKRIKFGFEWDYLRDYWINWIKFNISPRNRAKTILLDDIQK